MYNLTIITRMKGEISMKCENDNQCPCKSTSCANHGKCCACVKNHRSKGNLPYCLRPENTKK